jgi:hypothetical protein
MRWHIGPRPPSCKSVLRARGTALRKRQPNDSRGQLPNAAQGQCSGMRAAATAQRASSASPRTADSLKMRIPSLSGGGEAAGAAARVSAEERHADCICVGPIARRLALPRCHNHRQAREGRTLASTGFCRLLTMEVTSAWGWPTEDPQRRARSYPKNEYPPCKQRKRLVRSLKPVTARSPIARMNGRTWSRHLRSAGD